MLTARAAAKKVLNLVTAKKNCFNTIQNANFAIAKKMFYNTQNANF